jgi:DnaJ like chaperone protein
MRDDRSENSESVTNPRNLKKWLITIAILYLVFPRDLIPDFLGRGLGLIDDLLLIALLTYVYRKRLREHTTRKSRESEGQDQRERSSRGRAEPSESSFDPYGILGIDPSASGEEIHAAYKARMHEYHPDKVAHLGEELQKVAHRKAVEIQQAYEQLRK